MSNPKEGKLIDTSVPIAVPVYTTSPSSPEEEAKAPTFGIDVKPTKVYDEKTKSHHDACTITISPGAFLRDLLGWMKHYQVGKTLREWASQIKWKDEVRKPIKDWSKTVKWKDEVIDPVKDGLNQVNWEEEVWKPVKEVDWNKVHQDIKEATKDVDWQDAQKQVTESLKAVDWAGIHKEVKEGLDQVDWNAVRKEMKECKDAVGWDEVKEDLNLQEHLAQATTLFNKVKEEVAKEVDWEHVNEEDCPKNPDYDPDH